MQLTVRQVTTIKMRLSSAGRMITLKRLITFYSIMDKGRALRIDDSDVRHHLIFDETQPSMQSYAIKLL